MDIRLIRLICLIRLISIILIHQNNYSKYKGSAFDFPLPNALFQWKKIMSPIEFNCNFHKFSGIFNTLLLAICDIL